MVRNWITQPIFITMLVHIKMCNVIKRIERKVAGHLAVNAHVFAIFIAPIEELISLTILYAGRAKK